MTICHSPKVSQYPIIAVCITTYMFLTTTELSTRSPSLSGNQRQCNQQCQPRYLGGPARRARGHRRRRPKDHRHGGRRRRRRGGGHDDERQRGQRQRRLPCHSLLLSTVAALPNRIVDRRNVRCHDVSILKIHHPYYGMILVSKRMNSITAHVDGAYQGLT